MNTTFKAIFNYSEEPTIQSKLLMEQVYFKMYNLYCDIANPMFDIWNRDWESNGGKFEEGFDTPYAKYIISKEQEVVDRYINKAWNDLYDGDMDVKFFIGEEADFRIKFKDVFNNNKEIEMQMFLREG